MKEKFTSQKRIEELNDCLWDVTIIGAGPAGASLAISLAGENHRVLLLDKETFPRDKLCGDLIATYIFERLKKLDVYDSICKKGHELRKSDIYKKNYDFCSTDFYKSELLKSTETPDGLKGPVILKRSVLDSIIAEKSVEKGAIFVKGYITEIEQEKSNISISLKNSDKTIKSKIAVIATGADIRLLKGLELIEEGKSSAVALQCYVKSDFYIEGTVLYYDLYENPGGYCWIFPMGNKIYNTGSMITIENRVKNRALREIFNDFVSAFPPAEKLLKNGEIISKISYGKSRWGLTGIKSSWPGNIMAIGETIGSTLPGLGEGIGRAILSAKIASEVINETLKSGDFSHMKKYPLLLKEKLYIDGVI